MELKDIAELAPFLRSESFKDSLTNLDKSKVDYSTEKDDILKDLQSEKIVSLKEMIEDIQNLIVERENLHTEILEDAEKVKTSINNFISAAGNTEIKEQLALRQKEVEIDEVKIQEKLDKWRDIAQLKKELRERVKEFQEIESRADMLDHILEE